MSLAALDPPTTSDVEPLAESLGAEVTSLFEQARRRRRRRVLVTTMIACVTLFLGAWFLITGGAGRWFGGPPAHFSNSGPMGGTTTHLPSPTSHPVTPLGQPVCGKGITFLAPNGTATSASLLPCFEAPKFPKGVATFPSP